MKVINKKMCVVFVLVILEISSLFLMYKSNSNKEIKLENIKNDSSKNNMLAIMVEQSNGSYTNYTSSNTFPSGYLFNKEKSICVDNNGERIDNALSFNNSSYSVTVNTGKTSQCYIYLDEKTAANEIKEKQGVWKSSLESDGYRYYGTDPANYICFGTRTKGECVLNSDKYMYRIIGAFQEETTNNGFKTVNKNSRFHLKLIKKEALESMYDWDDDLWQFRTWEESTLSKGLNGSYFLTNTTYSYMQNTSWKNKISDWTWQMTNTNVDENDYVFNYYNLPTSKVYLDEMNRSSKDVNYTLYDTPSKAYKIGLMYISDYLLSLGSVALDYSSASNSADFKTGWMHLINNDTEDLSTTGINPLGSQEWMMTRGGSDMGVNSAWLSTDGGYPYFVFVTSGASETLVVRPVFYLNSNVKISSGTGTVSDPYILAA